jgi:flavodoxin I
MKLFITASFILSSCTAFAPRFGVVSRGHILQLDAAKVGIFFGTSTGSTESVADMIKEQLGDDADGPFDIETLEGSVAENFGKYGSLIVGTPTWNTGAETERSGTGWDEIYYSTMQELNLQGKKVGVFGLGDQESYSENYADASGELHDVFESLGCQMMGYTSQEGYEHDDSKAIRGDKFCGLLCDEVNQEELSEERVKNWISQLGVEGFLEGGSVSVPSAATTVIDVEPVETFSALEENSEILDQTIESHANTGFTPYYNDKTKSTMWVSPDGRSCYYTAEPVSSTAGISP